MKILELPVPTIVNCECGCSFEFEPIDLEVSTMYINHHEFRWIRVVCPFCTKSHELKKIELDS